MHFVAFLKTKDEALIHLKEIILQVERQYSGMPKQIRTDGGGEFVNQKLTDFLAEKGITHQVTMPYAPHQNGLIERGNRTGSVRLEAGVQRCGIEHDSVHRLGL